MEPWGNKYYSFMLRLWQAFTEGGPSWRASLEDSRTGKRTGFSGLDELFEYLSDQIGEGGDGERTRTGSVATPEKPTEPESWRTTLHDSDLDPK